MEYRMMHPLLVTVIAIDMKLKFEGKLLKLLSPQLYVYKGGGLSKMHKWKCWDAHSIRKEKILAELGPSSILITLAK